MTPDRSSVLALLSLLIAGCSDEVGPFGVGGSTTTTTGESTNSGLGATSRVDASTGMPIGTSGSDQGVEDDCAPDLAIPPPPVDCAGAHWVHEGSVLIDEDGDDPSILEGVVRVTGAIRIVGTDLTNLDFMACVEEVGTDVTIFDNDQLTDVQGLWSITSIGTSFSFSRNDAIEIFDGLPKLPGMYEAVSFRENASLLEIRGFQSLVELEGPMFIPPDISIVTGELRIEENPVLRSIEGLRGTEVIASHLSIVGNPSLCSSEVVCVLEGIEQPSEPPPEWSIEDIDGEC